ncbi:hypothetical protein GCM10010330_24530 [Streptomyces tendae]|nr:hypothetical protein GCM10010330_24530 [Streptomyces tendae]
MVVHVDRGHRHDRDHDEPSEDHDQRTQDHSSAALAAVGVIGGGRVGRGVGLLGLGKGAGQEQRVGAQPEGEDERGQRVRGAGDDEEPGEVGDAEVFGEGAGGGCEVGPGDAAERGGDQDAGDGTRPWSRSCRSSLGLWPETAPAGQ